MNGRGRIDVLVGERIDVVIPKKVISILLGEVKMRQTKVMKEQSSCVRSGTVIHAGRIEWRAVNAPFKCPCPDRK